MPEADYVKSTTQMSCIQEPFYYTDQPITYSGHDISAYQPWNQYPMNYLYMYYLIPLQAIYVPSQVPASQMPMYNQFPPIQNQLYTPGGNEYTVSMSTCVPWERLMYCPVSLTSKVPTKPMYDTHILEYDFAELIWMLKDKRYQNKSEAFLRVYAPHAWELEEDGVYKELKCNLTKKPRWEVPTEENNRGTEENGSEFYAPVYSDKVTNKLYTPCTNY